MPSFDQDLIAAASRGDAGAVNDFMAAGADWRAEDQKALYLAARGGHAGVMRLFLRDLVLPAAERECHAQYTNGFVPTADEVESFVSRAAGIIDAALADPPAYSVTLLTLAVKYDAPGLFRAMMEEDAARTVQYGALAAALTGKAGFVPALLDAGAEMDFVSGPLLANIIRAADMPALTALAARGFDFNIARHGDAPFPHPLAIALGIGDAEKRKQAVDFLAAQGADLRVNGLADAAALVQHGDSALRAAVFDLIDRQSPGAQLGMLLALEADAKDPKGARDDFMARWPYLRHWYMYDFIVPLMDGTATGGDRWFENVRMTDRGADDNFLIKAAVVSAQDKAMVPYLLESGGVCLNTAHDRPLTLAVLLGKRHLFEVMAAHGADPYAGKAEAFDLARRRGDMETLRALRAMAKETERGSQKKLMQRAPDGLSAEILRAGEEETGLYLAARAGMMSLLLRQGLLSGMTAEDFLKPSATGGTVAHALCAREEHAVLFDSGLWGRDVESPRTVFQNLSAADQKKARPYYDILLQHVVAAENRQALQRKVPRLSLPGRAAPKDRPPPS